MALAKVDIFNLALVTLGAQTVSTTTEGSKNAKACNAVYEQLRRAELRKRGGWNFAIVLAQLPALSTTPLFDKSFAYQCPSDFLAMANPFPESNYNDKDWVIQNGQIYTRYSAPLNIRYVRDEQDTTKFDTLFANALSYQLAYIVNDSIVQSNSKKQIALDCYKTAIKEARQANSFDNVAPVMPLDTYFSVRL